MSQTSIAQQDELFGQNLDQIRKIQEMDQTLRFWKEKCIELKLSLDGQKVVFSNQTEEKEKIQLHNNKQQYDIQHSVAQVQKEIEQLSSQSNSLKMQIAQKDQQINTFQNQTSKHFDELNELQSKYETLKDNNQQQIVDKNKLEKQLKEMKDENSQLQTKSSESSNQMSPDQYLDVLGEEKDLTQMLHFCQLVNAKYFQMQSAQYLEQLSKGGPGATPTTPGMGPMGQMPGGMMPGLMQNPYGMNPQMQMGGQMQMQGMQPGMPQINPMFQGLSQQFPQLNGQTNNQAQDGQYGQMQM